MPSTCPASNYQKGYLYFPQSNCTPLDLTSAMTSKWTDGQIVHRIWANRWNGGKNKSPNPIRPTIRTSNGTECRLEYTSIAKADAATEAETAATLTYGAHDLHGFGYLDWTEAAGMPDSSVYDYTTFKANADALCTKPSGSYLLATDVVVLPVADVNNVPVVPREGVEVDYEVQDNHSVAQTNAVLAALSQMVHQKAYAFSFYTNPLDGPMLRCCSGIDPTNVDYIQSLVDRFGILVWQYNGQKSMVQSLSDQMNEFQDPNFSKMVLIVDMAMSVDNARLMRQAITQTYPFSGISVWFDKGVNLKGTCSSDPNQVLGIISGIMQ
jgi:hypothetical protein